MTVRYWPESNSKDVYEILCSRQIVIKLYKKVLVEPMFIQHSGPHLMNILQPSGFVQPISL